MPFHGRTLYGTSDYGSNQGDTKGSKIVINLGALSSIGSDCFSYFTTTAEPLFCSISSTTITIKS